MAMESDLQGLAGSAYWFPEFTPIPFFSLRCMFHLLRYLFISNITSHLYGSYPTYVPGLQHSFNAITLYVIIEDDFPIIRLLLQRFADPVVQFQFGSVEFHLIQIEHEDICRYRVYIQNCAFTLIVVAIDTVHSTGTFGNVDFVHFVWENFDHFGFRRHSITLIPDIRNQGRPRMSCLRHYMAAGSGWEYVSRCLMCEEEYREDTRLFTYCSAPGECPAYVRSVDDNLPP
jgi:hypothetical protein